MKVASILLVAALIIIGLLLFFRGGDDQEPLTGSQDDKTTQPALEETASLGTEGASTAVAREQASTERSHAEGILVQVVNAATDEPVPGANVYLMDRTSEYWARWQSRIAALPTWQQQDHLLAPRFGLAYTSNALGTLRLPPASPSSLVYALTADGLHSDRELDKAVNGVLRLPLTRITEINLRVLVEDGEPVRGRPLVLDLTGPKSMASVKGITDDQGLARVRLRSGMSLWGLRDWENLSVQLESPMLTVDRQILTREDEAYGIYTMRVQAGSLELRLPGDAQHAGEVGKLRLRTKGRGGEFAMDFEQGQGRIELLPLDLVIDAKLTYWESDRHYELSVEGPTQSGQTVVGQFQASPGPVALSFRLLDPEGRPLAGETLHIKQFGIGGSSQSNQAAVAADGRVQFFVNVLKEAQPNLQVLTLGRGAKRYFKRLEFPEPLPPGITDLGDVTMAWEPVVLAGKVVGVDGRGLAGVDVAARGILREKGRRMPGRMSKVRSGRDGSFTFRSWLEPGEMKLEASKEGWIQREPLPAKAGQQDLKLSMERAGSVEARLLTDFDPGPSLHFRLACEDASLRIRGRDAQLSPISPGVWRLRVTRLLPASYELKALARSSTLIRAYPGILVGSGETVSLGDLDLRGSLRRLVLTVVDQKGTPVPRVNARLRRAGVDGFSGAPSDRFGRSLVLHWGESVDAFFWKQGLGFGKVVDLRENQTLQLVRRQRRISLMGDLSFLRGEDLLRLEITIPDGEDPYPWTGRLSFKAGAGEQDSGLPDVSELDIAWSIRIAGGGVEKLGGSRIRVEGMAGSVLPIAVPEAVSEKMRALLSKRR